VIEFSVGQIIISLIVVMMTGVMSGFGGAWVAIRVLGKEIEWINKILDKHDKEIDRIHDRMSSHVQHFHNTRNSDDASGG